MRIIGYAIPFMKHSTDLGNFIEQFAPSSVDRTLRGIDVRALSHHDSGRLLGRVKSKTLRLVKDSFGLGFELLLPDTSDGRDMYELVRRRDLTGVSFGFRVAPGGEHWDLSGSVPVRTVTDAEIHEVSLVSWPAYESTTVGIAERNVTRASHSSVHRDPRWLRLQLAR